MKTLTQVVAGPGVRPVGDAPGWRADPRGNGKSQWGGEGGLRWLHPEEVERQGRFEGAPGGLDGLVGSGKGLCEAGTVTAWQWDLESLPVCLESPAVSNFQHVSLSS